MTACALVSRPLALVLPVGGGALSALVLSSSPQPLGILAICGLAALCAFVVWPWAALPTALIGGELAAQALGLQRVAPIVAVHILLLALGFLAVALRRGLDPLWGRRVATPADIPMIAFTALVVLGVAFGLATGNAQDRILVAAYELGVVPAYFFLATLTLSSPRRLRLACVLFALAAAAIALADFLEPGRHGGLFSVLALPAALTGAAGAASVSRRWLLLSAVVLFTLDIVLSAYRTTWVAAGVAVLVLLAWGSPAVRRTTTATLAAAVVVGLSAFMLTGALVPRVEAVAEALQQSSGYRLAETRVGWDAFLANPVIGQGLGQVEPDVFLLGFGLTDVGPLYHAFYLVLLTNMGLLGLAVFLWPLVTALRHGRGPGHGQAIAFRALLAGFMVAAAFAGPTDGHWELGLLAGLSLVAARFEHLEILR